MTVYGDDTVRVLRYNRALRIHAECSDLILIFRGAINDFAFIKLIRQMRKNFARKLNTNTDINSVGAFCNAHFVADGFHPFASASADGNDTIFAGIFFPCNFYFISAHDLTDFFNL